MRGSIVIALVLAAPVGVSAQRAISDNGQNVTLDCAGGAVVVSGNSNNVRLTGQCSAVMIGGNENTVTVDATTRIDISGNSNRVRWSSGTGGRDPAIRNSGNQNVIQRGAAATIAVVPASPPPPPPVGTATVEVVVTPPPEVEV